MASPHTISLANSPVDIDKKMIKAGDGSIFGIDIEYILGSGTEVESKL